MKKSKGSGVKRGGAKKGGKSPIKVGALPKNELSKKGTGAKKVY